MTTDRDTTAEPVARRVLRQVRSGQLDEDRLLPARDKRERDVRKGLARLAERKSWYVFVAGQAHGIATAKGPGKRNAEITLVREITRWRAEVERFAPGELAGFDALITDALEHPAALPQQQAS